MNNCQRSHKFVKKLRINWLRTFHINQKLDGIIYREKYRLRVYDKNTSFGKFEVKRKLNQVVEKLSMELTNVDVSNIITGDYSCLMNNADMAYVAYKLSYDNYSPKTIVEYFRKAYYLPFNRIRLTIDTGLSDYGFKDEFSNLDLGIQTLSFIIVSN